MKYEFNIPFTRTLDVADSGYLSLQLTNASSRTLSKEIEFQFPTKKFMVGCDGVNCNVNTETVWSASEKTTVNGIINDFKNL